MMRTFLVLLLLSCFLTPILSADLFAQDTAKPEPNTKASGRVEAAGTVLDEETARRCIEAGASPKKF